MDDDYLDWLADQSSALQRLAWGITGNREDAHDLAQDALVKALKHPGRVQSARHPSAYLRTIVVNCWRDRRLSKEVTLDGTDGSGLESSDQATDPAEQLLTDVLARALRDLSPQQRKIVALRYLDDQSVTSTAQILGTSTDTVKTQSFKALAKLRSHHQLASYLEEE